MMDTPDTELSLDGIAIIGMAGRFPGAPDIETFRHNLREGIHSLTTFTVDELRAAGIHIDLIENPDYVRARPILDNADLFDAAFFGYAPREAEQMDPQHRVFLECAWEALEHAGYAPERIAGQVGVYAGLSLNTYLLSNLCANRKIIEELTQSYQVGSFHTLLGNDKDFLPSRVAYKLNLRGPSVNVQTACSTSLVAIAQACQSLLNYQCDLALAGGVSISFPQRRGYLSQEGGMISPDGKIRAFDAAANGTVFGEGVGVVTLKRFAEAVEDGDTILAVIRGYAINNDGSAKVSYMAPSVDGQAEVIATALGMAGVEADSLSYVEAHGTGTPLGDPIEVAGLTKAFRMSTDRTGFCALGSAKTNIGHLDVAAGVAGVIRTAFALRDRELPPSLHFESPNPRIDFAGSPFYVNTRRMPWPDGPTPRRAGVSSFGVGGTNAHVVMEEAPLPPPPEPARSAQLLLLSAKTPTALDAMTANLADHLRNTPGISLADVAFTLQVGRQSFEHQRMTVCHSVEEAIEKLTSGNAKTTVTSVRDRQEPGVVFVFPGQGTQQIDMGRGLYESEPVFRDAVDRCCEILLPHLGVDLRTILYPTPDNREEAENTLLRTTVTQPALFVIEYALATLWMHWGIRPAAMIGHSLGEYTAACLAGVFSLEDTLALLSERARLMRSVEAGAMLAVRLPAAEVESLLNDSLSIAAINGPSLCVVAGPFEAIEALEAVLSERRVAARRLPTSHAFHSGMMDPIVGPYIERVAATPRHAPTIPFISNLSGDRIRSEEATDPTYWGRHLREAVRFEEGVRTLRSEPGFVFIEVGPGGSLSGLIRQQTDKSAKGRILTSLESEKPELDSLLFALGQAAMLGVTVDWQAFHAPWRRRRVPLPTYPFERKRFWVEPVHSESPATDQKIAVKAGEACFTVDVMNENQERGTSAMTVSANGSVATTVEPTRPSDRTVRLRNRLIELFQQASGMSLEGADPTAGFVELGFDSLFLTQAGQLLQKEFKVRVTFRQLMGDLSSLAALADHLDRTLPPDAPSPTVPPPSVASPTVPPVPAAPTPAPAVAAPVMANPVTPNPISAPQPSVVSAPVAFPSFAVPGTVSPEGASALERIAQQQLQAMSQLMAMQLQALQTGAIVPAPVVPFAAPVPLAASVPVAAQPSVSETSTVAGATANAPTEVKPAAVIGRFRPVNRGAVGELDARQVAFVDALVKRYVAKTPESKRQTALHRPYLADPRTVAGFRQQWKDMVYPLVFDRAAGSRLTDVDGNEYVDFVNGFGVTMFGHSPEFITRAVEAQIRKGVPIGPQTTLAGEVAKLVCELTGMERACFCNTGSEAVMAALRISRTVTGRDKVVVFAGGYHGTFDEVLVRPGLIDGRPGAKPLAPGIPQSSVDNMVVLEYGTEEALAYIRDNADDLAAVLVETVQSRRPELQPREFVAEVRRITEKSGTALIFDEIVTGFRVHPGGVQAVFGIRADIATYGKVIGGEYPVGILAGSRTFLDALDGGAWNYGDDSFPEVGMTFHAGTFMRHPQAVAATHAVLTHLKTEGPALQEKLNAKAARFVADLNACFERRQVPISAHHFGSVLHLTYDHDLKYLGLLYYLMRERGLYLLEGFPIYLTTVHTEEELTAAVRVFEDSLADLQSVGLLPGGSEVPAATTVAESPAPTVPSPRPVYIAQSPTTEAQKEIWFSARMGDDASCAYNESVSVTLRGTMDIEAMRQAIHGLIERHDALRSTFTDDGEFQKFRRELKIEIPVIDLSDLTPGGRAERIEECIAQDAATPFDLLNGPVFRAMLLRESATEHTVVLTAHHIVCDGFAFGVLLTELGALYSEAVGGDPADFPPAMQFAEYALLQEQDRSGEEVAAAAAYWKGVYAEPVPDLELPTDRPRPPFKSYNGSMERVIFDGQLLQDLNRFSGQRGTTLFTLLLSGFVLLLNRLTHQDDIVVGIPAAGQSMVGSSDLVGHCLNFLPVRTRLKPGATFAELAAGVKNEVLDAYDHQNYTYGTLIRTLDLPRNSSRIPLLSVMFNIDRAGMDGLVFRGLETKVRTNPKAFVNLDLFLNMVRTETELRLEMDFNTDLYDRETVRRWMFHYETLLRGIMADWNASLSALPLLSETDRHRLLVEWNATGADYPKDATLPRLLEEQAARTPDRTALVFQDRTLTYAEVHARANQLAHYLRKRGAGPETLIGLCVERSADMVISALGILKAGAAYVPLDPSFPEDRLAFMVEDARMPVVITERGLLDSLPVHQAKIVNLSLDHADIALESAENPSPVATAENLAYVLYTSGSTGKPKGVQIEHRALVNFLFSMKEKPGLSQDDVLAAVTTLSFDIAGLELWLPLMVGAQVVVVSREVASDGFALAKHMEEKRATVLQATPATWRLLTEADWKPAPDFKMLCGGEALPRDLAETLLRRSPELWNMYGPTETTIWSAASRVTSDSGSVPVGPPIANTQFYILDEQGQPVPVGVAGELCIGGDGLARGYLNRPELTAEKFVPDPFAATPDARMYRTGDLARYLPNGYLDFLGRIDNQVKVRGFRIELGEIENAIREHADVRDAVVVAREEAGTKRLVAYVVPTEAVTDRTEGANALRRFIENKLPDYMVPAIFVSLSSLPQTPNGKIDRRALPAPDWSSVRSESKYVAPGTDTEKTLAGIWADVLRLEQVGIHDNIFDLGADSLLIFRITTRTQQAGIQITPRQVFQHRTIAELAQVVTKAESQATTPVTPSISRLSRDANRVKRSSLQ
ncbi:MAG: amino acid adenylation domain-containing protein [Capsulimonadales bacterium]|nr:amino acid adenylation domain-containing protein [Capsulimonadales bacterium]